MRAFPYHVDVQFRVVKADAAQDAEDGLDEAGVVHRPIENDVAKVAGAVVDVCQIGGAEDAILFHSAHTRVAEAPNLRPALFIGDVMHNLRDRVLALRPSEYVSKPGG